MHLGDRKVAALLEEPSTVGFGMRLLSRERMGWAILNLSGLRGRSHVTLQKFERIHGDGSGDGDGDGCGCGCGGCCCSC